MGKSPHGSMMPKIRTEAGKKQVFDPIRRKYVSLSPEEWIRQNFLLHLIHQMNYPLERISVESGLKINRLRKRTDILVYGRDSKPWMIIECKAPEIAINQKVFDQAVRYNYELRAAFIVVTNGQNTFTCFINYNDSRTDFIEFLPLYPSHE
ncbi:MAG: type I restriction enzyme HsdR N-terminal domain-containing protein [Bacteroidales bacterium]|nr:type I restriction enzyme HsdR N-terminal domain-containing protein [Bacteroidales bacterium]